MYGPGARGEETRQDLLATCLVQAKEQRRADLTRRRGERKYRVVVVVVVVMMDDEERGCRSFDHQKQARHEAKRGKIQPGCSKPEAKKGLSVRSKELQCPRREREGKEEVACFEMQHNTTQQASVCLQEQTLLQ